VAVIAKTAFRTVLRLITSARQVESQTFGSPHQALYSEPAFYVWFSLYDCELYNLPLYGVDWAGENTRHPIGHRGLPNHLGLCSSSLTTRVISEGTGRTYSDLRATIGSTLVARRAGI
jgi:hypothetical protein